MSGTGMGLTPTFGEPTKKKMNAFDVERTNADGTTEAMTVFAFTADAARLLASVGGHTVNLVKEA